MNRRALVLTQESAGHAFRRALPPHVFAVTTVAQELAENAQAKHRWRIAGSDWRGFLTTYCASFVAISVFIA